jgi:hypothetical protein
MTAGVVCVSVTPPTSPIKETSRTFSICRTVWKLQEKSRCGRFWKHYVIREYLKADFGWRKKCIVIRDRSEKWLVSNLNKRTERPEIYWWTLIVQLSSLSGTLRDTKAWLALPVFTPFKAVLACRHQKFQTTTVPPPPTGGCRDGRWHVSLSVGYALCIIIYNCITASKTYFVSVLHSQ